ncbi:MaoC family dehydratase [Sphingobium aquiterrae]|uniref:MaoC family dehydratase n=1 Tax=Sphingobium aquiterrae TaxID=2038656 RepID=UPI00301ABF3B
MADDGANGNAVAYFEDIAIGQKEPFGPYEVNRDEVIAFASAYDPQPFHLDDEAAAQTHFGRVAASGWHTTAMFMSMFVKTMQEQGERQKASLGALGVDELRWLRPVYPGDTLSGEIEVIEKTPSRSRPEMGVIKSRVTVHNQHGEPVLSMQPLTMVRTRPK